jgi:glycosyltransferase involved in cell wall biosynthesis
VFTAAPDPHIVIDSMQDIERLDRARFAVEDAAHQFWFRARMVERLTAQADRLTLLPRPTIADELTELVGVDADDLSNRATVVPEGVDVIEIDRARARAMAVGDSCRVAAIRATMPAERRELPWVLTVGRLHPSKGPHRIVEAIVGDPSLASRLNVVIVGGDVVDPSPDEQSSIELIRRAALQAAPGAVTLTGHLPPADVADVMVATVARGGIYVCASDKEEFGLSIVEALAAGAVVVAPSRGGPRTYVEGGLGVLCDTTSVAALRGAVRDAMHLIDEPGRARRARTMVRNRLSIDRMAERLGEVYRDLLRSPVPT